MYLPLIVIVVSVIIITKLTNVKQTLKTKLDQYGYVYTEKGNLLEIKMELGQIIKVDFSDKDKILITDKFTKWNPLTGWRIKSLKSALLCQSISLIAVYIVLLLIPDLLSSATFIIKFIPYGFGWVLLWGMFFLVKSENMKRQIITWLDAAK